MDIKKITDTIKSKGRVSIQEKSGMKFDLITQESWDSKTDDSQGVYLLFDLFQIRSLTEQFSEISLDIVEFTTKPVIFHSPVNRVVINGPLVSGKVKFWMIREGVWSKVLFAIGKPVIFQKSSAAPDVVVDENFIMANKEMFLGPEGDVKILG
ncbi:hypothetical protein [Litoribacter populi]|uniref:hypothetical protein n=1 Tax=Litoribacter populi TaxID=2598460 RepID=UPI00117DE692|nr:hypothetical protein [Litoribacter populi]